MPGGQSRLTHRYKQLGLDWHPDIQERGSDLVCSQVHFRRTPQVWCSIQHALGFAQAKCPRILPSVRTHLAGGMVKLQGMRSRMRSRMRQRVETISMAMAQIPARYQTELDEAVVTAQSQRKHNPYHSVPHGNAASGDSEEVAVDRDLPRQRVVSIVQGPAASFESGAGEPPIRLERRSLCRYVQRIQLSAGIATP